jgi:hypothetical protein
LSCLDASHPQHSYLCRLYRHSLTGHSTGLDWLAAHLKALAAHTHNNTPDTTQDTGTTHRRLARETEGKGRVG